MGRLRSLILDHFWALVIAAWAMLCLALAGFGVVTWGHGAIVFLAPFVILVVGGVILLCNTDFSH